MGTLIGHSNETSVIFCETETYALIDSGSQVTTISEDFFNSLSPTPRIVPLSALKLNLEGPDRRKLPYLSCILARIMVPFCSVPITVLALVVPNTRYNSQVPVLIGTNVIEKVKDKCPADKVSEIPSQWNNAFLSLQNGFFGFVKSTNNHENECQTISAKTTTVTHFPSQ